MNFKKSANHFNPLARLGKRKYSIRFPFAAVFVTTILIEVYGYYIIQNPKAIGLYAIVLLIALIIYFSFRDGLAGGYMATSLTILYYLYIVASREYTGAQLQSSLWTILVLGILYFALATIIGWLKQTIDISFEREADARRRLQTILHQLPVGIIITNKVGQIELANQQAEDILGVSIRPNQDFSTAESNSPQHQIAQFLTPQKKLVQKDLDFKQLENGIVNLHVMQVPINNQLGKCVASAIIINDITQQKQNDIRKDDFINMASHELKTPITSIKLYLDILTKSLDMRKNNRVTKIILGVKTQTERLHKLVDEMLDVSRIETGKLKLFKETFRLDDLVKEAIEALQPPTDKPKLILAQARIVNVYGDKFRLYQVITNLITNAIKYSAGGTTIKIRVYKQDQKAVVSVQDFGIGIAKRQQKMIFERLYQVTDPTEKTFAGFGMGLYIAKQILNRHQGKIWVDSQKGKGSTFYFSLPLKKN